MTYLLRSALLVSGAVLACLGPADAAVIFGDGAGLGVRIGSSSTAEAKAPAGFGTYGGPYTDPETRSSALLPAGSFSTHSYAEANDVDRSFTHEWNAVASNTTSVAFASASSAVVTFQGYAGAGAQAPGLARASSSYFFEYVFTLTDANAFDLSYAYSSSNLGCCGNAISLQNRNTGQAVLLKTVYGADNMGALSAVLQAGSYALMVNKSEYYGYDAPAFNGSVGGTTISHEDRFTFSIQGLAVPGVPEPATWATMTAGFGLVGGTLRRRPREGRARPAA